MKARKKAVKTDDTTVKRKPGRQPMSAEEKEAAAKARAAEKEKASNLRPEVFVQFQENEIPVDALVDAAKDDFHKSKKRTLVTALKLYIKPEEHVAYYVINEIHEGKVQF